MPATVTCIMSRLCQSCSRNPIGSSAIIGSFQHLQTKTKYSTAYRFGNNGTSSLLSDKVMTKRYNSTWNSQKPSELDRLTPIDKEKALFLIKRRMGAAHSKGTEVKTLWLLFRGIMGRFCFKLWS